MHRWDGGAQPGLLVACHCQAGAPADGGAQAVGGGGPELAAAVRQLTTVSVCGSWWSSDFSQIRLTRQRFSRSGTHGAPSQLAGATGLRRALLRLSVGSVSAMPGAPAAAADADEVADDPVVGAINTLIEEGKLVNVIEDPRKSGSWYNDEIVEAYSHLLRREQTKTTGLVIYPGGVHSNASTGFRLWPPGLVDGCREKRVHVALWVVCPSLPRLPLYVYYVRRGRL